MRNMSGRVMSPWTQGSHRSRVRSSSRCSFVESNFNKISNTDTLDRCSTPVIPEVYIKPRSRPREISINDAPMMLLPRARVRGKADYLQHQRAKTCSVIADTSTQGLHISTIASVDSAQLRTSPPKSALKTRRNSLTRSEADSGIGSLKRAVTFDNLSQSQSTVFNIDDDLDSLSDRSPDDHLDYADEDCGSSNHHIEVDFPDHLDTFGSGEPVICAHISEKTRPKSRTSNASGSASRRQTPRDNGDRGKYTCPGCGMVLSNDAGNVKKSVGQADNILDWVMSKWGKKRRELQYIPRNSYVYRGHVPHFCNFVQPVSLHNKAAGSQGDDSLIGVPQDDDEEEELKYITETAEGRLINKWRKDSQSSSKDRDRTPVPSLDDYLEESPEINIDIQNWMSGKKSSKSLLHNFSSIPEMKEDGLNSGTEGRPGSPSSQDGAEVQTDTNGPVMGVVTVTVSSPGRSEPESTQGTHVPSETRSESDLEQSYIGSNMPAVPEEGHVPDHLSSAGNSDGKGSKGADSLLILTNVDRDTNSKNSNHSNERAPSPQEPPPSPIPVKVPQKKSPEPPTTGRRKSCVNKKTKKPIERTRKLKPIEPPPTEPVVVETEQMETPASASQDSEKTQEKLELQVPDLPSTVEEKKSKKKEKSKPKRHLIEAEDDLLKVDPIDILNDQLKHNRIEIDFSGMDNNIMDEVRRPPPIKTWMNGRLALSQQSSRFSLPMDMKKLETMSPEEYIKNHCIITSRRQNLYSKIFMKNKDKTHTIPFKDLDRTLKDVLVHTITSEQVQGVLDTFNINDNTRMDSKYFSGLAAFAERILYPKYVTEDTVDMPEYQREKIECADFCALDWKFHGVNINPAMLHLLNQLR